MYEAPPPGLPPGWNPSALRRILCAAIILLALTAGAFCLGLYSAFAY